MDNYYKAEKYYSENKESIINKLMRLDYSIDEQVEYDQVVVWFSSFSICYQNGDMNGAHKGSAVWDNPGAAYVFTELGNVLIKEYPDLYAKDEVYPREFVNQIVNDFCERFAKDKNIDGMFDA